MGGGKRKRRKRRRREEGKNGRNGGKGLEGLEGKRQKLPRRTSGCAAPPSQSAKRQSKVRSAFSHPGTVDGRERL